MRFFQELAQIQHSLLCELTSSEASPLLTESLHKHSPTADHARGTGLRAEYTEVHATQVLGVSHPHPSTYFCIALPECIFKLWEQIPPKHGQASIPLRSNPQPTRDGS